MKKIVEILGYLSNYKARITLNLIYNLLNAVFSVISFSAIIPFLKILFDRAENGPGDQSADLGDGFLDALNHWFDVYITENGTRHALMIFCIVVVILFMIRNLFRYLAMHQMAFLRNAVVRDVRQNIYAKLLMLPMAFYTGERKGHIYSRFTSDVSEIEWSVMGALEALFKQPILIAAYLVSLLAISWQLTLFVLVVLPLAGLIIGRIGKSLKKTAKKGQNELGQVVSAVEETVGGIRIVKGFTAEESFFERFVKMNNYHFRLMVKLFRKQYLASPISETLSIFTVALILWFGGNLVLEGRMLNGEMFILYIAIFSQMISPSRSLTEAFTRVQRGVSASERIDEILLAEEQVLQVDKPTVLGEFEGDIEFKNVGFKYEDQWVLKNINLKIGKGQSLALVGPSGGGKSTLVDLLPRFYDIIEGELLIDGKSIDQLNVKELRSQFGIVSQQSVLFNDSVRNNLLIGNSDATDEQIITALHAANAHGFVMALPEGLDTTIGESGNKLSGGQKQRLSIARAILKDPPVLILDEATSALDTESERLVQEALAKVMEGRTSFLIAHRLSTISHVDRIAVINQGQIAEIGTHEQLMNQGGLYKKLVEMQEIDG
ncbi:ABC transporter ATP-binding protein/permease [bacterium]|nr:ABC transporter ATP-binding protein/permease [bacterium]MDC1221868.1 ABC transporter ATP-binding protein/permease [Salibacteraceae bacterium]